jgi:putative transposase
MKAVCEALGVARSNIAAGLRATLAKRVGRPPAPEEGLVARTKAIIGDQPTYGYRRVWAMLKREGRE